MSPTGSAGQPSPRWWAATVVLLLVAGGLFTVAAGDRGVLAIDVVAPTESPTASAGSAAGGPAEVAPTGIDGSGPAPAAEARAAPAAEARAESTAPVEAEKPTGRSADGPVATASPTDLARRPAARTRVPAVGTDRSTPVGLRIPAIGVSVPVSALGLNPDDTVEVPTDFQKPGWFELGPTPGRTGSAVILGHVDSTRGPAVFFRLKQVTAGDEVEVDLADGTVARFVVDAVATYPKKQFPAREVYASRGYPALQLVTCGGEFDTRTGHYLSNVVVYTTLLTTTPPLAP